MKNKINALLLLVALLYSASTLAKDCVVSWDASASSNVTDYNVYNGADIIWTTKQLSYNLSPCEQGEYSVTAVNSYGIESDNSNSATVGKPDAPRNFSILALIAQLFSYIFKG